MAKKKELKRLSTTYSRIWSTAAIEIDTLAATLRRNEEGDTDGIGQSKHSKRTGIGWSERFEEREPYSPAAIDGEKAKVASCVVLSTQIGRSRCGQH
jgi:hypothetical protein